MFERVTILGVGLLGASLGLALKERGLAGRVAGVGRRGSPSLKIARERGAIDEAFEEVAPAVADADLVVVCTPVGQFPAMFRELGPAMKRRGAIVTDVGSTKTQVMKWAQELLPPAGADGSGAVFIGSHPMAGSEKRGPEHARADLYEGSLCFLCTETGAGKSSGAGADHALLALEKIQALWRRLGMRTLWLPAAEHDRWVAAISHLPHAAAFSLVTTAAREPAMLQAAANGFLDTTRVASSDVEMWTDIFMTNRDAVVRALDTFVSDLAALKFAIAAGDAAGIRATLSAAKKTRDDLLEQRKAMVESQGHSGEGDPE